jgi:DnaJ-class molecular chaperone
VRVTVPKELSAEQRRLLEALAESLGTPVHEGGRGILGRILDALG